MIDKAVAELSKLIESLPTADSVAMGVCSATRFLHSEFLRTMNSLLLLSSALPKCPLNSSDALVVVSSAALVHDGDPDHDPGRRSARSGSFLGCEEHQTNNSSSFFAFTAVR